MRFTAALMAILLTTGLAAAERPMPLAGFLKAPALWDAYKRSFVSPAGRVIDNANRGISHSEGQGYAMLIAVAADDRATFDLLWSWTRSSLLVRDDDLAAWRWDPAATPHVTDRNDASDGDVLIAWALVEAGQAWSKPAYAVAGLRIMRGPCGDQPRRDGGRPDAAAGLVGFSGLGTAPTARWSTRPTTSFQRSPASPTSRRRDPGAVSVTPGCASWLPPGRPAIPAERLGLARRRIPGTGAGLRPRLRVRRDPHPALPDLGRPRRSQTAGDFRATVLRPRRYAQRIDVRSGETLGAMSDSGFGAIAALTRCALTGARLPADLTSPTVDRYYPTTLRALTLIVARQRYPQCL